MSRVPLCVSHMRTLSLGFSCTQTIQDDLTSRPWDICKAAISKPGHVHEFGQQPPGRRSEPWGRGQHLARGCPRGRVGRLRGPPPSGPLCFLQEPLRPVTWTGLWVALGPHPGSSHSSICPPCSLGCLVGAQPSPHGCRSDSVGLRGWNQDSASLRACVSFPRDLVEVKELVRLEILFRSHVSPGMTLHTAQSLSRRCPRRPTRGPCTDAWAEAGRPQGSRPRRAGSGPAAWLLGSSCPLLCRSDVLPRRQTRPGEGCVRNPRNNF